MTDQTGNRIKDNSVWWSLFYLILGSSYILASDLWLFRTDANPEQRLISITKGLAYVLVTAIILFLMMRQNSGSLRRLARRLLDSDARLRRIFDTAEEGLVVLDSKGRITDVNHRMCDILGLPANQIVGVAFSDFLAPSSRDLLRSQYFTATGKRKVADIELLASGRRCWFQAAWNDFDEGNGKQFVFLLTDISERIAREREVVNQNKELEQRVKDRTAKLEDLNRELSAFSYSVSHDLREPIRAINGLSTILVEDYLESQPPGAQEIIGRIRANAVRMNGMIDSLLKLSRLTSASHKIERVSLTDVARKAFQEAIPKSAQDKIEFEVADGLEADCDADLTQIALMNLIGNAWKFNKDKSGLKIEVGSKTIDGGVAFFVRDNGIGFRSESAADIFKPFNRLSRDVEGEGIGLATVQRIVARHNGRVWAESAPQKGACFWFTLSEGNP